MSSTNIPKKFVVGETISFLISESQYPASAGWTATFYLRGASQLNQPATAEGDNFRFVCTATATAALSPGHYFFQVVVTDGSVKHVSASGQIEALASLAAVNA